VGPFAVSRAEASRARGTGEATCTGQNHA